MTKETPWAGTFCKKADPMVLKDLEKRGLLFDAPNFEHNYPHCWRCDTPLIYYAQRVLVHQDDSSKRGPDPQQQHNQLDSGEHRKGTFRGLAGECAGLGDQP